MIVILWWYFIESNIRGVYTNIAAYKQLPEGVERDTRFNRMEIALVNRLVLVHAVLKWLHHLSTKNVMLLHPASSTQELLHAARLETLPGD